MIEDTMYDHTPGPWHLMRLGDLESMKRFCPVDKTKMSILMRVKEAGKVFACVYADADAKLIAAAPDLLKERDELRERISRIKAIAVMDYPDYEMQLSDILEACL